MTICTAGRVADILPQALPDLATSGYWCVALAEPGRTSWPRALMRQLLPTEDQDTFVWHKRQALPSESAAFRGRVLSRYGWVADEVAMTMCFRTSNAEHWAQVAEVTDQHWDATVKLLDSASGPTDTCLAIGKSSGLASWCRATTTLSTVSSAVHDLLAHPDGAAAAAVTLTAFIRASIILGFNPVLQGIAEGTRVLVLFGSEREVGSCTRAVAATGEMMPLSSHPAGQPTFHFPLAP